MTNDLDTQVIDFIARVVSAMGLHLGTETEETPDHVRINITGEGAEALTRRKGEALDALQVIVNTAFRRDARGDRHYVIDALGFRRDQDAELRETARRLVEKVKSTGRPEQIGPLNPYARRVVHLVVTEDAEVTSESTGDAFLKTVVISPK
jgi:spoIIIJ-associated protein